MNIKRSDGTSINTEDMTDVDSVIMELAEKLRIFCKDNRRQCFIMVDALKKNGSGAFNWNLYSKSSPEDNTHLQEDVQKFFETMDYAIGQISQGQLEIRNTTPPPEEQE